MLIASTNTTQQLEPKIGYGALHNKFQLAPHNFISTSSTYGMVMPSRSISSSSYRYGFNGMEKDDELKESGNSYTTDWRQYDSRIGRWMSIDPLFKKYTSFSPYCAFNNNPIAYADPSGAGADVKVTTDTEGKTTAKVEATIYIYTDPNSGVSIQDFAKKLEAELNCGYNENSPTMTAIKPQKDINGNKVIKGEEGKLGGQQVQVPVEFIFTVIAIDGGPDEALGIANSNVDIKNNFYYINNTSGPVGVNHNYGGNSGVLNQNANPNSWLHEIGHNFGWVPSFNNWGLHSNNPTSIMFERGSIVISLPGIDRPFYSGLNNNAPLKNNQSIGKYQGNFIYRGNDLNNAINNKKWNIYY